MNRLVSFNFVKSGYLIVRLQREAFLPLSREEETAVKRAFSANDSYDFDSWSLVYLL